MQYSGAPVGFTYLFPSPRYHYMYCLLPENDYFLYILPYLSGKITSNLLLSIPELEISKAVFIITVLLCIYDNFSAYNL